MLHPRHLSDEILEVGTVGVKLDEDATGERTRGGPHAGMALESLDDMPRQVRIAIQAAHRDAGTSECPMSLANHCGAIAHQGGWWRYRAYPRCRLRRGLGNLPPGARKAAASMAAGS